MLNMNELMAQLELLRLENAALIKDKKRLDFIESVSHEAIAVFDENIRCIDINERTIEIFGYTRDEIQGMLGIDLIAPESKELALKNALEHITKPYEALMLRKDGSKFWGLIQGRVAEYDGMSVRVVTCRDITEQKKQQEATGLLNAEYETIFNNSQVGILLLSADRIIERANQKLADIFGYDSVNDLVGESVEKIHLSPENYNEFGDFYKTILLQGLPVKTEYQFKNSAGKAIWVSLSGSIVDKGFPPSLDKGVVWVFENIESRKRAEARLQEAYSELEIIFNNAMMGIMLLKGGRFMYKVNQVLADIFGYDTPEEMEGMSVRQLHLDDESFEEFGKNFYNALVFHEVHAADFQVRRKDGAVIWVAASGKAIDTNIPADLDKGVIWSIMDITKRKNAEEQLIELARKDGLTGSYNRRYFYELAQLELQIHRRYNRPLSFISIDIDYFKSINDTYGHAVGDKALVLFAKTVNGVIREVDIFGRLGGEEFGICLLEINLKQALALAEKIQKKIVTVFPDVCEGIPDLTASMGVVEIAEMESFESAVKRADKLLYLAKNEGRNLVKY